MWGDVSPSGQYCVGCMGMCVWGDGHLDSIVSAAWECACGVMFPHLDSIVSAAWECACGVMFPHLDSIVLAAWECACGVMFPHLDSIVLAEWECACGVMAIWTVLCRLRGNVRVG